MKQNNSPWLTQLDQQREMKTLEQDIETDVVIVGGGIAGVTTLYFLLKHTDKKVVLLEGHKIAHGATGHNAGQVVAEFERPLKSIVNEFGMKMATDGFHMMEQAWDLIDEIMTETQMDIPFKEFIGYGGYTMTEQLLVDLETEKIKKDAGLISFPILVARESGWMQQIPSQYHDLCTEVDHSSIKDLLGTVHDGYQAVLPEKKATVNSSLFTEQLMGWCMAHYPNRCTVFEMSHVHGIELDAAQPKVITNAGIVTTKQVVLCTNGFDTFYIHDQQGTAIDTKFHHLVQGKVGYMTAFATRDELDPMANYYYEPGMVRTADTFHSDPYFYVTRRKFETGNDHHHLMAIGGPEVHLENREIYFRDFDVASSFRENSIAFAARHFDMSPFDEKFFWHGLMGYTRTGLRIVGREPLDPRLMYNLGCNGVGILPSIMGSRKIARHVNNEDMTETIFDPRR